MRNTLLPVVFLCSASVAGAADREAAPSLESLLANAARYVAAYETEFAYLVAEERYTQKLSYGSGVRRVRELRSDIVFVPLPTALRWTAFRDVYEMDGKPVGNRRALLKQLFIDPAPNAVSRAAEVLDTSARFNLGASFRNTNIPTLALVFLHAENQSHFRFDLHGGRRIGGVHGWDVSFVETATPTFVRDHQRDIDLPCRGRIWLAADGRVLRSELTHGDIAMKVGIDVEFGPWQGSTVWMPISMTDSTEAVKAWRSGEHVRSTARYHNFRRYQVHIESEGITK